MGNSISSKVISDPTKYATEVRSDRPDDHDYRKYDYIVVGGGASCVIECIMYRMLTVIMT